MNKVMTIFVALGALLVWVGVAFASDMAFRLQLFSPKRPWRACVR